MDFKVGDKVRLINKYKSRYIKNEHNKTTVFDKHIYGIIVNNINGPSMYVDWYLKDNTVLKDWGVYTIPNGTNICEVEHFDDPNAFKIEDTLKNLDILAKKYEK